jgi:hypothetical protein
MNLEKFINITWYMNHKPYSHHSAYDLFYLKMCRRIFKIISELPAQYTTVMQMNNEDSRDTAYILTAYFEDRVNNIGFWESLVALHKKQFGKRVPFFDLSDLKAQEDLHEDIFPADVHYLLFVSYIIQQTNDREKPVIRFDDPFFIELTKRVFEYMDETEEVPQTAFYESFLTAPDDYFDLKRMLQWFVFGSYLTGKEFSRKLQNHISRQNNEDKDPQLADVMLYAEEDRLMCEEPSSLTAFFPVDILAGAMHGSDEMKASVANLKWRPYGIFQIAGETATHFHFIHTATGEEFDVVIESFNEPLKVKKQGNYWLTKLAPWNGDAWISGACMAMPLSQEEIAETNTADQHIFLKHYRPYRQKIKKLALEYRHKSATFFKGDLVVFGSGRELQEKMNAFSLWHFQTLADKAKMGKDVHPPEFPMSKDMLAAEDIALFIPPADNICFILEHKKSLRALQGGPEMAADEVLEALFWLMDDSVDSEYCFYLRKNFPLKNLSLFLPRQTATDQDFEALLRIYKPGDFSPLCLPAFSISSLEEQLEEGA